VDEDSGLQYFLARYYDPEVGRFLSKDPEPNINLYVYCDNNPINMIDPDGRASAPARRGRGSIKAERESKMYYNFGTDPLNQDVDVLAALLRNKEYGSAAGFTITSAVSNFTGDLDEVKEMSMDVQKGIYAKLVKEMKEKYNYDYSVIGESGKVMIWDAIKDAEKKLRKLSEKAETNKKNKKAKKPEPDKPVDTSLGEKEEDKKIVK